MAAGPETSMLQSLTQGVWFDESVRLVRLHWATRDGHQSDLPTLFLDDYTVLSEVRDLRSLVEGDHCVAPVNILHTLFGWFDRFLFELASWEALPLRLHHHFIILDTVFDVTADGPVTKSGRPVRVAEYSDSFPNAWRRICPGFEFPRGLYRTGLRQVLANAQAVLTEPAKMHAPLLRDYVPHLLTGAAPRGLFVVQYEQWTAEDRRRIRDRARALVGAPSHPTYRIFTSNCEHFTWSVKGGDARWVSPQVSYHGWNTLRFSIQLLSLACLVAIALQTPALAQSAAAQAASPPGCTPLSVDTADLPSASPAHAPSPSAWIPLCEVCYHVLATLPVVFQLVAQLTRTTIHLTLRREALGVSFHYLIVKECLRGCLVGALTVPTLALTPRFVGATGRLNLACAVTLTAFGTANLLFNVAHQAFVRVMLASGAGVPVPIFEDTRHAFTTGCTTENSASARAAPAAPHCLPVSLVAAALNAASGAHAAAVAGAGADGDIDIDENDAVVLCEAVLAGEDVAAVPRMGRRVRALRSPARCRDM